MIYIKFLKDNAKDFETEHERRTKTVFKRLSDILKTKQIKQCKSHHQKMISQHETIEQIAEYH